jgi:hypothetical protein
MSEYGKDWLAENKRNPVLDEISQGDDTGPIINYCNTFCKTKDGSIWIVFSTEDNGDVYLIPQSYWTTPRGGYDAEVIAATKYHISDIVISDRLLSVVEEYNISDLKEK